MERLRPARRRRGLVGKLTDDPAIEAAAAAVFLGVDPGWVLDQPIEDLPIVERILQRATDLRVKYDEDLAQAIGGRVAEKVVPPLGKQLRGVTMAIGQLARAISKRRVF